MLLQGQFSLTKQSMSSKFSHNYDHIFPRKTGKQWAKELGIKNLLPLAWESKSDFETREISKSKFRELVEKSNQ